MHPIEIGKCNRSQILSDENSIFSRLIEFWRDVFPNEPVLDFTMEQCPMLIGIINRSRYKFTPLLQGDTLIHTEKFSPQVVLNELSIFRDKFEVLVS